MKHITITDVSVKEGTNDKGPWANAFITDQDGQYWSVFDSKKVDVATILALRRGDVIAAELWQGRRLGARRGAVTPGPTRPGPGEERVDRAAVRRRHDTRPLCRAAGATHQAGRSHRDISGRRQGRRRPGRGLDRQPIPGCARRQRGRRRQGHGRDGRGAACRCRYCRRAARRRPGLRRHGQDERQRRRRC